MESNFSTIVDCHSKPRHCQFTHILSLNRCSALGTEKDQHIMNRRIHGHVAANKERHVVHIVLRCKTWLRWPHDQLNTFWAYSPLNSHSLTRHKHIQFWETHRTQLYNYNRHWRLNFYHPSPWLLVGWKLSSYFCPSQTVSFIRGKRHSLADQRHIKHQLITLFELQPIQPAQNYPQTQEHFPSQQDVPQRYQIRRKPVPSRVISNPLTSRREPSKKEVVGPIALVAQRHTAHLHPPSKHHQSVRGRIEYVDDESYGKERKG